MNKSEFVEQVASRSGLAKKDAASAVEAALETIESALERGGEVAITGFGKFHVAKRNARQEHHAGVQVALVDLDAVPGNPRCVERHQTCDVREDEALSACDLHARIIACGDSRAETWESPRVGFDYGSGTTCPTQVSPLASLFVLSGQVVLS